MKGTILALALLGWPAVAAAQEVHGQDSLFAAPGVAIAWGVLRSTAEAETQVVVRIAGRGEAYRFVSVEAVDPFTRERQPVLDGRPLGDQVDVRSPRAGFADFPRREIHLYRTAEDLRARRPTLTVYYLGVPDTTPEFTTEAALTTYLASALSKAHDPR